ncbi:MAG: hypothetical protein NTX53_18745 [candidate division WOR-3 bacterium]|nr:hypothetical protein [candidate division WOR-3 bacterium]
MRTCSAALLLTIALVPLACKRDPLNPLDPNNPYTLGTEYVCRAESCGIGRVKLSWDRIIQPQIKGYRVYRSKPGETPVAIGDADTSIYYDSHLAAGQKYVYYYRILWEDGREIHKSPEDTVTTFDAPPGLAVKNVSRTRIELGWDSLNWLDNFRCCRVYRKQAGDFQLYDSTTANEYVDTSVQEGTTYHYTIAAVASDSGASNSTGEVYATPGNTPPRIDSIVPANPVALWGDSVTITCYAFDNDGDSIHYDWAALDGGTISGGGQSIVFTVPQDSQATHRVRVTVSDSFGTGGVAVESVSSLVGWVRIDTSGPARIAPIAYDSKRRRIVLFGGANGPDYFNDTWEWDGQDWIMVATQGPSPRAFGVLVYDEARADVLLFGGIDSYGDTYDETWVWDGSAWSQKQVSGPSGRYHCACAYDSGRQRVVLFGGTGGSSDVYNETWEWDGGQWSLRSTTGPCPRFGAAMAYDKGSGKCVLFGGWTAWYGGSPLHDTWVWDGSTWTQVDTAGPPARFLFTMAYEGSRGRTVLFGGTQSLSMPRPWLNDTWEWDGHEWIQSSTSAAPSARLMEMTYQQDRQRIVAYGGTNDVDFYNDLWIYP